MVFEKLIWPRLLSVMLLCGAVVAVANEAVAPDDVPIVADETVALANGPLPELVDPTRPIAFTGPLGMARGAEKKLQLQAIFYGEHRREAVINGRTVKVGETVDQAKILAIGPGRVSYFKNGNKGELVLLPQVLQPVQGED